MPPKHHHEQPEGQTESIVKMTNGHRPKLAIDVNKLLKRITFRNIGILLAIFGVGYSPVKDAIKVAQPAAPVAVPDAGSRKMFEKAVLDRFNSIDSRFDHLDRRLDDFEERFDRFHSTFNSITNENVTLNPQ